MINESIIKKIVQVLAEDTVHFVSPKKMTEGVIISFYYVLIFVYRNFKCTVLRFRDLVKRPQTKQPFVFPVFRFEILNTLKLSGRICIVVLVLFKCSRFTRVNSHMVTLSFFASKRSTKYKKSDLKSDKFVICFFVKFHTILPEFRVLHMVKQLCYNISG